ncbi:MAG: PAS domain S-box protein [Acidobacteria bacterium]|nr:PAS domain S-box protein [Acidobacteriota bacterium]
MKPTRTHQLIAGFVVALGLFGAVAWIGEFRITRAQETAALVAHTHEVQAELSQLLSLMQDVETGERGFVVTGDPAFLEPFESASVRAYGNFRSLCALASGDPHQPVNCDALAPLIARRIARSQANVDLRRNVGFEAARQAMAGGEGKAIMDQIRAVIARMDNEEQMLLGQRSAAAKRETSGAVWLSVAGAGLGFILLAGMFALVLRENRLRQQTQVQVDRFFTLSLDMLCIADMNGYFKRLSPAFNQTLGYTTDELLARPFLDFVHPDDRAATLAEMEKLSRGVPTVQFENRYRCQDGSWRWLSWKTQPVAEEGLLYATARDITERRVSEQSLREANTFLDSVIENIPNMVFIKDAADLRFVRFNRAGETLIGRSRDQLVGRNDYDLFPREEADFFTAKDREVLASGTVLDIPEEPINVADGGIRTLHTKKLPVLDENGRPTYLLGISEDITERKQAEEALKQNEQRLSLALDAGDMGAWDLDLVHDTAVRTLKHDQIFGYQSLQPQWGAEIFMGHVVPEDRDLVRQKFEEAFAMDRLQFECRILWSDHSLHWVAAHGLVYRDQQGAPARMRGIVMDITGRKQAEEQIARLNADLQLGALHLQEANKELEAFSYSVSHDLRAPLRHVHGYVEMLQRATDGQLSEQAQRFLNTITEASAEMEQLIDDLLAFSRMGRAEMRESRVRLDDAVQDTIRGLEMATPGRNIVWRTAPLPPVVGDPALIKQVLANLMGNAVKYSRMRDPAEIEIGCAGEEDERIILFVRDNGAGFDMQYAHKLFGVFQRLHRAEEFEGTGIGLATVQRIVARHGGRVWAEGAVNEGATFYFTLQPSPSA